MSTFYATYSGVGGSGGVTSLNSLTGALVLVAGTGISVTPAGSNITIAATGGSGANTTLSNLDTPTAINQDLLFDNAADRIVATAHVAGNTKSLFVQSGNSSGGDTGVFYGGSGDAFGTSGTAFFGTGNGLGTDSGSGEVIIIPGAPTGNGTPGGIEITTPNTSGTGGVSSIILQAGSNSDANTGGNITLQVREDGVIKLDDTTAQVGYVWTATNVDGSGNWEAASGGEATGARVTLNAQGASPATFAQLTFNATTYDTEGYVSGDTFVAPVDGFYLIQSRVYINPATAAVDNLFLAYSINNAMGADEEFAAAEAATSAILRCNGGVTLKLTAGDAVRFWYEATNSITGIYANITKL